MGFSSRRLALRCRAAVLSTVVAGDGELTHAAAKEGEGVVLVVAAVVSRGAVTAVKVARSTS